MPWVTAGKWPSRDLCIAILIPVSKKALSERFACSLLGNPAGHRQLQPRASLQPVELPFLQEAWPRCALCCAQEEQRVPSCLVRPRAESWRWLAGTKLSSQIQARKGLADHHCRAPSLSTSTHLQKGAGDGPTPGFSALPSLRILPTLP